MTRTTLRDLSPWAVIALAMSLCAWLQPQHAEAILSSGITAAAAYLTPRVQGGATVTAKAGDPPTVTAEPAE